MAQFLGDIAFALWTVLFAGGLIAWHIGTKEAAGLIKTAALVMVVVGIGGAVCTGYFWFKYEQAGAFDNAYPKMGMEMMGGAPMRPMMQMMMGGENMKAREKPGQPALENEAPLTPEQQELLENPNKHPM
ncbi:MAG: hypothetical protein RIF37_06690 [Rhodospirillaceae bacterium]